MLIPKEIQKKIKNCSLTDEDDDILDEISMNEVLTERIIRYEAFIKENQKLYQKFLKKTKKEWLSSEA